MLVLTACLRPLQVGSIDNEFRVFNMEVLAGRDSTETEVVQHKARFKLDFAKVGGVGRAWGTPAGHMGPTAVLSSRHGLSDLIAGTCLAALHQREWSCTM